MSAMRWITLVLVLGSLITLSPLWAWLVLAAWFASLARPVFAKMAKSLGGRERAGAAVTTLLLLAFIIPVAVLLISLGTSAADLGQRILHSQGGRAALEAVVSSGSPSGASVPATSFDLQQGIELLKEHGEKAWSVVSTIAGATAEAALGLFVFIVSAYTFLVDGSRAKAWFEAHAPIKVEHFRRLAAAFTETGRGLLIGMGLTGLAQAVIATIAYFALGVPRALVLGLLTLFASLIPSIGTALVWVPIAAGLALTGRTVPAIVLTVIGVAVIGTVDNVMRPVFAHFGQLEMPSYVLLIAIFGGLAVFGGWGLILGPLVVRLTMEALAITREDQGLPSYAPPPSSRLL